MRYGELAKAKRAKKGEISQDESAESGQVDMNQDSLFARLESLTSRVNQTLQSVLEEDGGFFGEVGVYSFLGGGKRLRPLIFCLCCGALGAEVDESVLKQASSFELLHMATLMHDDIIDQSDTRRGRSAVHHVFGIPEAVMAADYLLAKAALINYTKSSLKTIKLMIELLRSLSLGELGELKARRKASLSAASYMDIIYLKTAALLETIGQTTAVMHDADEAITKALGDYGRHMGLAFQITDDVLDYRAKVHALGKPVGQDLAEGRITLPFILARESLSGADKARLIELGSAENLSAESLAEAKELVEKGQGIELALKEASRLAKEAIEALGKLSPSSELDLLADLAIYSVQRDR